MATRHLPWDRSHWASIIQVPRMPKANVTQKEKPCPAAETSPATTEPCKDHTSLSFCLPQPFRDISSALPAGLASLAQGRARDQPTARAVR